MGALEFFPLRGMNTDQRQSEKVDGQADLPNNACHPAKQKNMLVLQDSSSARQFERSVSDFQISRKSLKEWGIDSVRDGDYVRVQELIAKGISRCSPQPMAEKATSCARKGAPQATVENFQVAPT